VVPAGSPQHLAAHLALPPRAQDVLHRPLLQYRDGAGADHAAIRHPAYLLETEALSQALDHREQRSAVGVVPWPQRTADRAACAGEDSPHDHLPQVSAVLLRMAILPETLPALAVEVSAGGVEECHGEVREQVAALPEERFLDGGLRLSQPAHGPVKMGQLQGFGPWDADIPAPAFGRPVWARLEEAVEHGEVDGTFHRDLEAALPQQVGQEVLQAHRLPQAAEDQVRAQLPHGTGFQLTLAMGRDQPYLRSEPSEGTEEDIDGPRGRQLIDPTQGGEHALHGALPLAAVFHERQ
jgi:hypothetical protein